MQWEKPNPTTLSNLPYTINSTYQSAHSTASICATNNTHGCFWHTRIERNLFPTLPRRSLPKIIQNHFINYFYCGQLQTENHHHQKTVWTCWWTLHGLSAPSVQEGNCCTDGAATEGIDGAATEGMALTKPVAPFLVSTIWSSTETCKLKQKFMVLAREKNQLW